MASSPVLMNDRVFIALWPVVTFRFGEWAVFRESSHTLGTDDDSPSFIGRIAWSLRMLTHHNAFRALYLEIGTLVVAASDVAFDYGGASDLHRFQTIKLLQLRIHLTVMPWARRAALVIMNPHASSGVVNRRH